MKIRLKMIIQPALNALNGRCPLKSLEEHPEVNSEQAFRPLQKEQLCLLRIS